MNTRIAPKLGANVAAALALAAGALLVGCAAGPNAAEPDNSSVSLGRAAERGDWPRVNALMRSLLVPELGDYFPGQSDGTVRRGSWLVERPAGKLAGIERVAVEVARLWWRDLKSAADSTWPSPWSDLAADPYRRRPESLKRIPALMAMHRAKILQAATPEEVVARYAELARPWTLELARLEAGPDGSALAAEIRSTRMALVAVGVDVYWWLPPPTGEAHRRMAAELDRLAAWNSAARSAVQEMMAEYESAWRLPTAIIEPGAPSLAIQRVWDALDN